ncbi:hypothetical protein J6590_054855 [Homalodisca vitripennis]|nr:hypothetical protein J6590_054855 [Homalodisca vitripennis]
MSGEERQCIWTECVLECKCPKVYFSRTRAESRGGRSGQKEVIKKCEVCRVIGESAFVGEVKVLLPCNTESSA